MYELITMPLHIRKKWTHTNHLHDTPAARKIQTLMRTAKAVTAAEADTNHAFRIPFLPHPRLQIRIQRGWFPPSGLEMDLSAGFKAKPTCDITLCISRIFSLFGPAQSAHVTFARTWAIFSICSCPKCACDIRAHMGDFLRLALPCL